MYRVVSVSLIASFLFVPVLGAGEPGKKIEIVARELKSTKVTVSTDDTVLVYYDDSVIKAGGASYNRETNLLTLDGDIEMISSQGSKHKSEYMQINTKSDAIEFRELFLISPNDIWLLSNSAQKKEKTYMLSESMFSSCDIGDPIWKIHFDRSEYDSEEKYIEMYGVKAYFLDTPILYTPYLAFSTDKQRSSGFLFPLFGYSENEGFIYEQPIFWNIAPNMDMEFNPQIRTNRSVGIYTTFRFVDSSTSSGILRAGYFRDEKAYQLEESNENQSHYGLEFNYDASELFSGRFSDEVKDGLYINSTFLNDIDYINLQKTERLQKAQLAEFGLTPLHESQFNYFIHNDMYYGGMNARYFIDTREGVDDEETLQILPSLQLHKSLNHIFLENLTYSLDFHFNNYDRQKGATLKQAEVKIPLEFTAALFDDYLSFSLGEEFYFSKLFFDNGTYTHDTFEYYSNIHQAKLFSDLTKRYDNFIHVMQPYVKYVLPGNEIQNPVDFEALTAEQQSLFTVGLPEEHFSVGLGHYFYNENMKLIFFQRLSKRYYEKSGNTVYEDLNNEMQYHWKNWKFYTDLRYSCEFKEIRESSSRISFDEKEYDLSLGHTYKKQLPDDDIDFIPANDIRFTFNYKLNTDVAFNGGLAYNIDDESTHQWRIGGSYTQECWSVDFSLRKDIVPQPSGSEEETGFYVQIDFTPFSGKRRGN